MKQKMPTENDIVMPSRHEIETAFVRLRALHGMTSARDLDVLWRAIAAKRRVEDEEAQN
jgi:hypothetical protein